MFLLSFPLTVTCEAQSGKQIDISKLVQITKASDYYALVNLSKELSYFTIDSSKLKDGSFSFISREMKLYGNVLSCGTDSKLKIKQVIFSTYEKETYDQLKKRLASMALKSSGIAKGRLPGIIESEDFEGKDIYVSTAVKKDDEGKSQYEFTLFKW